MKCRKCGGDLAVERRCSSVTMRCRECATRYAIHEVADQLDRETEIQLERYSAIIYD